MLKVSFVKIFGILVTLGILSTLFFFLKFVEADPTPSLRSRGLIVVETGERSRPWTARVVITASEISEITFVISGYAPDTEKDDTAAWSPVATPVTLSFVGFGDDKVVCEGLDLETVKYGDLNESLKQLIRTDINADGPSSALSQSEDFIDRITGTREGNTKDGEDGSEEIFTSVADEKIQVLQSRIGLWADERNAWDRQHRILTSGKPALEYLFAQECTLPSSNVWETRGEKSWPESTYSSFLPPQINLLSFTSDENADEDGNYLDKLASYYEVNRVEQQRLTESYPSVVPSLYGWGALAESNNFSLGESYVDYSVPPSYLFEKRNAPLEHDMAGIGLGASIGVTISCLIAFLTGIFRVR